MVAGILANRFVSGLLEQYQPGKLRQDLIAIHTG
jgi:hypothetical protein